MNSSALTQAQPPQPRSWLARLALGLIGLYQRYISPMTPPSCRFSPTCSAYAKEAIEQHGWSHGVWLAFHRLTRCHPLHPGGFDPVPLVGVSETQDPNWRVAPSSKQERSISS